MTHGGPFQPLLFCDSVILSAARRGSSPVWTSPAAEIQPPTRVKDAPMCGEGLAQVAWDFTLGGKNKKQKFGAQERAGGERGAALGGIRRHDAASFGGSPLIGVS